jgi:hypothetical protein
MWTGVAVLLLSVSTVSAQDVRVDLGVTAERSGASLNVDLHYNTRRFFGVARIFIDEQQTNHEPRNVDDNSFVAEGGVGVLLRKGQTMIGPLAGVDTRGRVIAGSAFAGKFLDHFFSYLGYAELPTTSTHQTGTRHRLLVDLKKDKKLFLRWDWKTVESSQEHSRLGIEFHTKFHKANLPVYVEPYWNFVGRQLGVRAGIKL